MKTAAASKIESGSFLRVASEPKAPRQKPAPKPLGVVDQVREALKPKARLATFLGFMLGGFVPLASFIVAHYEVSTAEGYFQMGTLLVLGGLVYSAKTVFDWGRLAFTSGFKSLGFCVLMEGVMITSHTAWLSFLALGYLIGINGIATGVKLALAQGKR